MTSRRMLFLGITALALHVLAGTSAAEMYKWIDKDGALHITDYPPPGGGKPMDLESIAINRVGSGASRGAAGRGPTAPEDPARSPARAETARAREYPRVEVYGTTWCAACRQAREFFRSAGVPFDDYDVDKDKEARARMNRLGGGPAIPAIVIGSQIMRGFSQEWCEMALRVR